MAVGAATGSRSTTLSPEVRAALMTLRTSPRCAGGITRLLSTVADTVSIPPVPPNEDASSPKNTTQPKTHPKRDPQTRAEGQTTIETVQIADPAAFEPGDCRVEPDQAALHTRVR